MFINILIFEHVIRSKKEEKGKKQDEENNERRQPSELPFVQAVAGDVECITLRYLLYSRH